MSNASTPELPKKCKCGQYATLDCASCKRRVCDDSNCGTETVDGFLCGSYTQWGCARKYTTCDVCLDDKAIHESDLNECETCGVTQCDTCLESHDCTADDEDDDDLQAENHDQE